MQVDKETVADVKNLAKVKAHVLFQIPLILFVYNFFSIQFIVFAHFFLCLFFSFGCIVINMEMLDISFCVSSHMLFQKKILTHSHSLPSKSYLFIDLPCVKREGFFFILSSRVCCLVFSLIP